MSLRVRLGVIAAAVAVLLTACSDPDDGGDTIGEPEEMRTARLPSDATTPGPVVPPHTADPPPPPSTVPTREPTSRQTADPRWVFYTDDRSPRSSAWFRGRHPVMIPFGCTPAPYYDPDPACGGKQGFHHGVDIAMPCGTPLLAGRAGRVLDNGNLGTAYGNHPLLLRVAGQDVLLGHTRRVFVRTGQQVERGQRIALAGDSGAPDGCHLHFEVRPAGGGYLDAVDPARLLGLS